MLLIYRLIAALLVVLISVVTLRERSFERQVAGGVVLVPLLLRILLWK